MTTEASEEPEVVQKTDESEHSDRLDPWIEDGNIVLAVQGKHFHVHCSTLSTYSEVFKGMFESIEPSEGGSPELIEQCPVIHLHDQIADVQIVLKAMHDRSYPVPYYERVPFYIVSAFLRLGEKYAIDRLVDEAKARLSCAFEPTLSVAAKMAPTSMVFSNSGTLSLFPGITGCDPHNFQVMNLLRRWISGRHSCWPCTNAS